MINEAVMVPSSEITAVIMAVLLGGCQGITARENEDDLRCVTIAAPC